MKWVAAVFVLLWIAVAVFLARRWRVEHAPPEAPGRTVCESGPEASLVWLARHQSPDGGWSGTRFNERCAGATLCTGAAPAEDDVELTALATLAFLGAGYTPQSCASFRDPHSGEPVRFGDTVRRGMLFLLHHQSADGALHDGPIHVRHHALATLALCEAYGIASAAAYHGPAVHALAFLESSRAPGSVWSTTPGASDVDDLATGEAAMALKSADISGLGSNAATAAAVSSWAHSPALDGPLPTGTAYRLLTRLYIERKRNPEDAADAAALVASLPDWRHPDFDHWAIATLALFQQDGPSGPNWKAWNKKMADTLLSHQAGRRDGCRDGSWDGPRGRVRSTAQAALTLEIYYRYPSVSGGH